MTAEMLELLVCPVTHSRLRQEGEFLVAERGGLKYAVKDGIPILLPEQAILPEGVATLEEFKQRFVTK